MPENRHVNAAIMGTVRDLPVVVMGVVNALKLVSVQQQRQGKVLATLTRIIWVDPATYLPVRLTNQWTRPMVSVPMRFDIRWLPPTSVNLAQLTVRIPPGFTQVHIH